MKANYPPRLRAGMAGVLLFLSSPSLAAYPPDDSSGVFKKWLFQTRTAIQLLYLEQAVIYDPLAERLNAINVQLNTPKYSTPELGYPLLLEKIQLQEHLQTIRANADLKLLRLRFRKSIEILKILYEKILSMDHHFTSLRTNQQVMKISNPHEYAEFKEVRTILQDRMKKKFGFVMPAVMENNPYLSAAFSIIGLTLGGGDQKLSRTQLEKIACILDFTVRMHQDLSVIYYETEYLRDGNLTLKNTCENLFGDCARQVGYAIPLTVCRESDDWERLYFMVDNYVEKAAATPDPASLQKVNINLQFSIDRVVHFIEKYCSFVDQGNEYYKKFDKITNNYSNEKACSEALPETFAQLKADINTTLEKFNSAYKLPEIQGSRLKDLLYGIGE